MLHTHTSQSVKTNSDRRRLLQGDMQRLQSKVEALAEQQADLLNDDEEPATPMGRHGSEAGGMHTSLEEAEDEMRSLVARHSKLQVLTTSSMLAMLPSGPMQHTATLLASMHAIPAVQALCVMQDDRRRLQGKDLPSEAVQVSAPSCMYQSSTEPRCLSSKPPGLQPKAGFTSNGMHSILLQAFHFGSLHYAPICMD